MYSLVIAALILLGAPRLQAQEAPTGWVVLPIADYRALHDKAYPPTPAPVKPPVEATLTRVDYELRTSGEMALGEARLTVDVFKDGWVRVPIPPGLKVRSARLDGRPVALMETGQAGKGPSVPTILLSKPGRSIVAMDIAVPLTSSAGTESLSLPAAGAAVCQATLVVPRDGLDVKLSGALLADATSGKGETRWVANGTGTAVSFSWQRRAEDRHAVLPLRYRGGTTEYVGLGEDSAQITAEVRIEVAHGQASAVTLPVPDGVLVTQVSGTNVGDWEVKSGSLVVTFLEPVEVAETIVIVGEAHLPREGVLSVPLFRLKDAERETGGVAVEVLGAGEVTDRQARGLDPADPKDLGASIAARDSPMLVAFRFRAQDRDASRSLTVTVSRYTPQAVLQALVEEARYDVLLTEDGKTLVRARYAVRNNQQSFLTVKLPSSGTLWTASVSGRPVRPGRSPEESLLVPLEKGKAGDNSSAFAVEVVYLDRGASWGTEGHTKLGLPMVDIPVSRTGVTLYRSPRYRLTPEPGSFREQEYFEPSSLALRAAVAEDLKAAAVSNDDEFQKAGETTVAAGKPAFRHHAGVAGILPLQVSFPALGPGLFLASELTKEGDTPTIDLHFKRLKGGRS